MEGTADIVGSMDKVGNSVATIASATVGLGEAVICSAVGLGEAMVCITVGLGEGVEFVGLGDTDGL
jgi:hypothetical protein